MHIKGLRTQNSWSICKVNSDVRPRQNDTKDDDEHLIILCAQINISEIG